MSDQNFGKPTPSVTVDPAVMNGFGVRPVQLGVLGRRAAPGRVADVRGVRVFPPLVRQLRRDGQPGARGDGFLGVQRHAPVDPRLPGGGGTSIAGLSRREQDCRAPTTTSPRPATTAARFSTGTGSTSRRTSGRGPGVLLQGGISTGKHADGQLRDPRRAAGDQPARRAVLPPGDADFLTQMKLFGAYTRAEGRRAGQRRLPEHSRARSSRRTR